MFKKKTTIKVDDLEPIKKDEKDDSSGNIDFKYNRSKIKKKIGVTFLVITLLVLLATIYGVYEEFKEPLIEIGIIDEDIKLLPNIINHSINKKEDDLEITVDYRYIKNDQLERENNHFDYYTFQTEEEYKAINDIETIKTNIYFYEDDLIRDIYEIASKNEFMEAYYLMEAFLEEYPDKEEKLSDLREDLGSLARLFNEEVYIEEKTILPFINNPELLTYAFLNIELEAQKEFITLKDSHIVPTYRRYLKVFEKEEIRPSSLPNFSKQYNSISIRDKEIWKVTVGIGEKDIPAFNVYIIIDTKNSGQNKVYYVEQVEDNNIFFPTRYNQI